MKKIYALIVVCLAFAMAGSAQNRFIWNGSVSSDWNTAANWTLNGSPAPSAPNNAATDSAIFNTGAPAVTLGANVSVAALIVTNNTSAKITATAGAIVLTLNSTSASDPGLRIDAGSKLENDAAAGVDFNTEFVSGSKGTVNGEWQMSGNIATDALAYFFFDDNSVRLTFTAGSTLTIAPTGFIWPNEIIGDAALVFQANSTLDNKADNPSIPEANYDPASRIFLTGVIDGPPSLEENVAIGNLTYKCPAQTAPVGLAFPNGFNVKGNLDIQSTGTGSLILLTSQVSPGNTINVGINGSLTTSGNSDVIVSRDNSQHKIVILTVGNDITLAGTSFTLQASAVTTPTTLIARGNFSHTAGQFKVGSGTVLNTSDLFILEFNGSTNQTLSTIGITDPNDQLTLRMNNPLGLTLASAVQVGRVNFTGAGQGVINTTLANLLTISNTSGNAIVLNSPSSSGYIKGPFARKTITTAGLLFPTFLGGLERDVTVTPNAGGANTFVVGIVNGNNGAPLQSPITGISNYYWTITHPAGTAAATVLMQLADPVPTATATDTLVPISYDGAIWTDARPAANPTSAYIFPGNSSTGTLLSASQTSFTAFAIGVVSNGALPITLMSFTGRKEGNSAELAWKISDNSTPEKFEVLKSTDGAHFSSLGSLAGFVGKLDYSFNDATLLSGNNFYRLRMYDKDGSVTYSNIIVVMNGSKGVMISSMIPTVVQDRARLNISASIKGNLQLVVTDITGRVILQQVSSITGGNQEVWLNASSLRAGMYQVTGYLNNERTTTIRFIKQ